MTRARRTALLTIPLGALLLAGCGSEDAPTVSGGSTPATSTSPAGTSDSATADSPTSTESSSSSSSSSAATTGETPSAILTATKKAADEASSAHIAGKVSDDGKPLDVDIRGSVDGKNQQIIVKTPNEGAIAILTVDGKHYVKGDRTYWTKQGAPPATVNLVADKFIVAPASKAASFEKFTIKKILGDMGDEIDPSQATAANTTVVPVTEGGQPALKLSENGGDDTIFVTTDPKHYALRIIDGSDNITLTEWNTVPAYAAPPASQIVTPPAA